jgi:hypothetical protein
MGLDVAACERMHAYSKQTGIPLVIAHYRRALPLFVEVKRLVDAKTIGDITAVRIEMLKYDSGLLDPVENWRIDPSLSGGGYFYDLAPHQLDLVFYFFGKAKSYKGQAFNKVNLYKAEDTVNGEIILENGIQFKGNWCFCVEKGEEIDVFEITPYHPLSNEYEQLYIYELPCIGQDYYPLPQYSSALNFAFLSGELSYLAKSNIQNAVFPSFAMMFPKRPQSEEEKNVLRRTIDKLKGAENAGKAVAFFANSAEQMPKIESLPTNSNDKLFQEASALNTEQICFSHTIDPILMGVRTTGSLGGGADIKQAYVIFEKNVVKPLREIVQDIFNELLHIAKVKGELVINNFQIINETIVEVDEDASALATRLSSLNSELLAKVLENMTADEIRSLASLKPIVKPETPTA